MTASSLYATFSTDHEKERSGIHFEIGATRITIARAGGANKKFARVLEHKTKPHRRLIESKMMDREKGDELVRDTYAEAVILNWETATPETRNLAPELRQYQQGIEGPDGSLLPFTKENVVRTLADLPELYLQIQDVAQNATAYRKAELEADAGNS